MAQPNPKRPPLLQRLIDQLGGEAHPFPALPLAWFPAALIDDGGGYDGQPFDPRPDFVRADDAGWERTGPWKR